MEKISCTIYLAVNEDGGYEVAPHDDTVVERLQENEGGCACRIIKLVAWVTPPSYKEPVAEIDISDTAGKTIEVAVEENAS